MKTYAEYLNTMAVKALNIIAKQMGLKGYSKLRKAELIALIDSEVVIAHKEASNINTQMNQIKTWLTRHNIKRINAQTILGARLVDEIDAHKINFDHNTETVESAILSELAAIAEATYQAEREAEIVAIEVESTPNVKAITSVTFSHTLVKPAVVDAEAPVTPEVDIPSLQDLKDAYVNYRATVNTMGNTPARIKLVGKLRTLSAQLKAYGIKHPQYL
jgi:hypothetical protein